MSLFFFIAVVKSVLIFGEDMWVVTPCMGLFLGGVPGPGGLVINGAAPVAVGMW